MPQVTRALLFALLLMLGRAPAQDTYVEESLFVVEYGWETEKLFSYPQVVGQSLEQGRPLLCRIAVDDRGNVWLGDAKGAVVKGFSGSGESIGIPGRGLHPSDLPHRDHELPAEYKGSPSMFVTQLVSFARDGRGYTYCLVDPDTRVVVFGPNGEAVTSRASDDGDIRLELRGWEKMCYQLRQEMEERWPAIHEVSCDFDDCVYVTVGETAKGAAAKIAKFTEGLDFAGWREGRYVGPGGETYAFVDVGQNSAGSQVRRVDPDGSTAATLALRPPADTTSGHFHVGTGWVTPDALLADARGDLYLVFCDPTEDSRRADLWNEAHVTVCVYKFDKAGRFLTRISLPSVAATVTAPPIAVDLFGDVYYALYRRGGVEVRRQRRQAEASQD